MGDAAVEASSLEIMEDVDLNGTASCGSSSDDDEVVLGEDEKLSKDFPSGTSNSRSCDDSLEVFSKSEKGGDLNMEAEKVNAPESMDLFGFPATENPFNVDQPVLDWTGWGKSSDSQVSGSTENASNQHNSFNSPTNGGSTLTNGYTGLGSSEGSSAGSGSQRSQSVASLFEDDVEFVGVELERTEKAMEQAIKEGIVGEAGPLKRA